MTYARNLFTLVCFFGLAFTSSAIAGSVSDSSHGATVAFTWSVSGNVVNYTFTFSLNPAGTNVAGNWTMRKIADDSVVTYEVHNSVAGHSGESGTMTILPNCYVQFGVAIAWSYDGGGDSTPVYGEHIVSHTTYSITFKIPANTTSHAINYRFMQNGEQVNSYSSLPGDPASNILISGLETDDPVTMVEFQQQYKLVTVDGVTIQVPNGESSVREAGAGKPSLGGSTGTTTGGTGSGPPLVRQSPVISDTPHVSPSVPSPDPVSPTHKPSPNSSPSGSGGATKGDIEQQTNDIIDAINTQIDDDHASYVSIVRSVNDLKQSGVDNTNAIIDSVNGVKNSSDNVVKGINESNGYLANIDRMLSGGGNGSSNSGEAEAAGGSAKSASDSAFSAAGAGLPSAVEYSTGSAPNLTVTFPAAFGGATVDLNPFSEARFGGVCAWFRTATLWLAIVIFGQWLWSELGGWIRGVTNVQQAKGNTVAGTGGQVTALVAAGLMTAVIAGAVAALLAFSFNGVGLAFVKSAFSQNPLGSMATGACWMLNQILPVSALLSLYIAKAAFNMYATPVFAGAAALVRFIVP